MRLNPDLTGEAGVRPGQASGHTTPRWVKVFGVLALIAIAGFAALHLVGGEMGHLAHGDTDDHPPPAEHGPHAP